MLRWPTEVAPGLRASAVGLGNLVTEELVEGFGDLLRRASLDDIPVWKPMAETHLTIHFDTYSTSKTKFSITKPMDHYKSTTVSD